MRLLKRGLMQVLAVVASLSLLVVSPGIVTVGAMNDTTLQFVPDKTEVQAGDTVTLAVNVSGLPEIGWNLLEFRIAYDETQLKPVKQGTRDFKKGPAFGEDSLGSVNLEGNPVLCGVISPETSYDDGDILYLAFEVLDGVKAGTKLDLTATVKSFAYSIIENGASAGNQPLVPANSVYNVEMTVEGEEPIPSNTTLQFVPDKTEVKAGDTVTLAVNVSDLPENGWNLLEFEIAYDETQLKPVQQGTRDFKKGPAFGEDSMGSVNLEGNPVLCAVISSETNYDNGDILYIAFEVLDGVKDGTKLDLTVTVKNFAYSIVEDGVSVGKQPLVLPDSVYDVGLTVEEKKLISVEVTAPIKTEYQQGETALDLTGSKLTLVYSNGDTEEADITADMVSGFDATTFGDKTITVTYEGQTATFTITVVRKMVAVLLNSAPAKTEYQQYDTAMDLTGAKLTVVYNNGDTEEIDITADMVSGFDTNTLGDKTITVTYEGKTVTFTITVIRKVLVVMLNSAPTKTEYQQGETVLDLTGGKLTVVYSNSDTEEIDITAEMVSGFDTATTGDKTITVTYEGQAATFTITVVRVLTSIEVTAPTKTEYPQGEAALDLTGGKVTLKYSNGDIEEMDITADMVSGFDTVTTGDKTITVTYEGQAATFTITVKEEKPEYGNVNGSHDENGEPTVTAEDALLALQIATGKVTLTQQEKIVANVDGDEKGDITANDALLILQYATRKITLFPVEQ